MRQKEYAPFSNKQKNLAHNNWLIFYLVLLSIVVTGGFFATGYLGNIAREAIFNDSESAISILSVHLTDELKRIEGAVKVLSSSSLVIPALISRTDHNITQANSALDRFNTALDASVGYLMDSKGMTIASSNRSEPDSFVGKSYKFRSYFTQAIKGNPGRYFGLGVTSSKRGFYASFPVRDSKGTIVGVVVMKKDLDEIEEHLSGYPYFFFVNPQGIIFLSSNKEMLLKSMRPIDQEAQRALIFSKQFGDKPFETLLSQEVSDRTNITFRGKNYLVSRKVIDPEGWSVVVMAPTDRVTIYKSVGMIMTALICTLIIIPLIINYETARSAEILRESEERFRRLADSTFEGIVIHDKGEILDFNQPIVQMLGYEPDEALGKNIMKFIDPESRQLVLHHIQAGDEKPYEAIIKKKDGTTRIMELAGKPISFKGRAARVVAARDITERKHAEEALRESEVNFRRIFDQSPVGAAITSLDYYFTRVNEAMCRMLGYSAEEFASLRFIDITHPDHLGTDTEQVKLLASGEIDQYVTEKRYIRKDGEIIWGQLSVRAIRDATGRLLYFLPMILDITKRKRAEELYRTLAESSQVGVYITQKGRFIFVNPNVVEYTGYPESELIGLNIFHLAHPDDLGKARSYAIDMLKGRRSTPYEFRIIDRQGRIRWLMETVRSITYEGKQAVLGNVMDVTERHHMERMLRQGQKMEAIGTLAGGIAHDFNNILAAIIGYAELARSSVPEESAARRKLEQVLRAGSRASDLVKQILTFSRQTEQEKKPVQVMLVAKEAIRLLRSSLPSTIEIQQEISIPAEKGIVLADPIQIHQVLMNLCTNAAHAMRDKGGILSVKLSDFDADDHFILRHPDLQPGPYVGLAVSDTGQGMDAAVLERIFDPYFTTKGPGEGTGLGLAVVQGIVRSCGGGITVYSEPDKGTTFNVFLPRIEEAITPESSPMETLPVGDERILFIDDEEDLAEIGKEILESLGYNVVGQTNSTDALEIFRAHPDAFDLVITDMTMPGLTGIELAQKLMSIRPDIPIILCTGFSELINEKRARELGIRQFLMKPFVIDKLAKEIRGVLDDKK